MADNNPPLPPPPDYMAAMMQQFELNRQFMTGIMQQFPRLDANQQPLSITLPEFMRLSPSFFRNTVNPLDADDWLRDISYEMESAGVTPANYVTFATYLLKGPASQWWATHRQTLSPGTVVTWAEFKIAFRARYIPQAVIARKKAEFHSLVQGNKSVEVYQREFLDLSRYAEEDVPTDDRRQEKFREGLHHDIQLALLVQDYPDFATLVNKAIMVETGLKKHKEATRRNREAGSSSGSSSQKRRIWIPNSMFRPTAYVQRPSYAASRMPPPPPSQLSLRPHSFEPLCLVFRTGYASSVAAQVTMSETALRTRSKLCLPQLAVSTVSPATTMTGLLMVEVKPITLI
jgi:hypothetical protein